MSYATLLLKHVAVVRTDLISKRLTQNQMVLSNITIEYTVTLAMLYLAAD